MDFVVIFVICLLIGIDSGRYSEIAAARPDNCGIKAEVVCYYASWALYRPYEGQFTTNDIDPTLCTKLIYSFSGLNIDMLITSLDANSDFTLGGYSNFSAIKAANPCITTSIAIGGWNEGSIKFSIMASTDTSRTNFANAALNFIAYYGFDGLDVDWEYPTTRGGIDADSTNMVSLLETLKSTFQPWGFEVSVAVGMESSYYKMSDICKNVNYVHLMGYDVTKGDSNVTGLIAPFTPVSSVLSAWESSNGCSSSQLILGIPTYGRCFNLVDAANHDVGAPVAQTTCGGEWTNEDGFLSYYEIKSELSSGSCQGTEIQDGNVYTWCGDEWISYDNEDTAANKTQYVIDNNYGGIMIWSLDTDDFSGMYGQKYPLIKSIYNTIYNS